VNLIAISDADDPRVAPYRAIRERDLLAEGLFLAEGKFIVERLLAQSRFAPVSVFILDSKRAAMDAILATAPAGLPIYLAQPDVMNRIAGHDVHRGILALGAAQPRPPWTLPSMAASGRPLALLSGIANAENVGSIFRNAAGLGMGGVIVDHACIHPLSRRSVRVSMGTVLDLPWAEAATAAEALSDLTDQGYQAFALTPRAASDIAAMRFPARSVVVFGEEAHGLPESLMAKCVALKIPMSGAVDSLNVAASSAIVFEALRRQTNADVTRAAFDQGESS
jgi:tRNA G18 (ribose-2'-O)-methylase SpoU